MQMELETIHVKTYMAGPKTSSKKNGTMVFNKEKKWLSLETDMLGVRLGVSLLQVRDSMLLPRNESSDNAVLWLIV